MRGLRPRRRADDPTDIKAELLETIEGAIRRNWTFSRRGGDREACAAAGPVGVLLNCAGVVHAGTVLEIEDADLDFAT